MHTSDIRAAMEFEQGLKPGAEVIVRWTNGNRFFSARAEVVRVNTQSVRTRLIESVGGYTVGREIVAPRANPTGSGLLRWSFNNRVEPIGGYEPVQPTCKRGATR